MAKAKKTKKAVKKVVKKGGKKFPAFLKKGKKGTAEDQGRM
jgi:hypothetical protein